MKGERAMETEQYFQHLEKEVKKMYIVANAAKKNGFDPVSEVEVPLANTLAERVIGLVSVLYPQIYDQRIVARILALEKEYRSLDPAVALKIAEEVAKEKFCKFKDHLEAVEAGIRVALGYMTLGYVSSPIEGFIQLKVKKTAKGEDFLAAYFSGPIRSAGGTEAAFSLVVIDYLREMFGYALYDPSEDEVKRGVHECYEYHERINNLQYLPSEQEAEFLMQHLPIQLTGDPSEDKEVYNYKDLPRVETNFIRSGFALVFGEGMAQKAPKILARVSNLKNKGFTLTGWDWLEDYVKLQKKIKEGKQAGGSRGGATYMQDLVAGRPVFSHPSRSGGFRLRYGRARNTGYSTLALHPATMGVTQGFIAVGTQLKTEKPTKGCTVASCDSIDGPIVKLDDGSVKQLKTYEEAIRVYPSISEILYLGDLLVPYGDFLNRNHPLEAQGYIEQYWLAELIKAGGESELFPTLEQACAFSTQYGVALHPSFIFYWKEISREQFLGLLDWISRGKIIEGKLVLPYTSIDQVRFSLGKRALELLGCEHRLTTEHVVIEDEGARILLLALGVKNEQDLDAEAVRISTHLRDQQLLESTPLECVQALSPFPIRDKSGTFIGARMGRPEKAKLRVLTGSPHVLFPVGDEGGRLRSFQEALSQGSIHAEFPLYYCDVCKCENVYPVCEACKTVCTKRLYCRECTSAHADVCEQHGLGVEYSNRSLDIQTYFDRARKRLGLRNEEIQQVIKGVRGTSNKDHACEYLGKGLLRSRYGLNVNKDGTIRYDMTEMPLTHFKASEIGTSIERLHTLGYEKDITGAPLTHDDQVLALFPHDIVLPSCIASPDERADDVFIRVCKFLDDELEKIYLQPRLLNVSKREDLVGMLLACMAPHTASCVIGRIIGFSKVQALLASPYIHAAMRRDCDGDEAAVMLLLDLLLNFSRKFLPSHRGGTQDAPLVLNVRIRANEVDDMIFDLDVSQTIPLELYEAGARHASPSEIKMEQVKGRLGGDREFTDLHFSYPTTNLNFGAQCSSYKTLPTMQEKVEAMMILCKKLRAVDVSDVARLVIERHFIRDTRGNLKKFSMQVFRCIGCNESYRRPPLVGKCLKCGGRLIFTISEGSILKYMQPALDLAHNYHVSAYLLENLELTQMYIQSIFGREKEKQESIAKWF